MSRLLGESYKPDDYNDDYNNDSYENDSYKNNLGESRDSENFADLKKEKTAMDNEMGGFRVTQISDLLGRLEERLRRSENDREQNEREVEDLRRALESLEDKFLQTDKNIFDVEGRVARIDDIEHTMKTMNTADHLEFMGQINALNESMRKLDDKFDDGERAYLQIEQKMSNLRQAEEDWRASEEDLKKRQVNLEKSIYSRHEELEENLRQHQADQHDVIMQRQIETEQRLHDRQSEISETQTKHDRKMQDMASINEKLTLQLETAQGEQMRMVEKLDDILAQQSRINRRLDKSEQDKVRLQRKIDYVSEMVDRTNQALQAKAMVLLTDQNIAERSNRPYVKPALSRQEIKLDMSQDMVPDGHLAGNIGNHLDSHDIMNGDFGQDALEAETPVDLREEERRALTMRSEEIIKEILKNDDRDEASSHSPKTQAEKAAQKAEPEDFSQRLADFGDQDQQPQDAAIVHNDDTATALKENAQNNSQDKPQMDSSPDSSPDSAPDKGDDVLELHDNDKAKAKAEEENIAAKIDAQLAKMEAEAKDAEVTEPSKATQTAQAAKPAQVAQQDKPESSFQISPHQNDDMDDNLSAQIKGEDSGFIGRLVKHKAGIAAIAICVTTLSGWGIYAALKPSKSQQLQELQAALTRQAQNLQEPNTQLSAANAGLIGQAQDITAPVTSSESQLDTSDKAAAIDTGLLNDELRGDELAVQPTASAPASASSPASSPASSIEASSNNSVANKAAALDDVTANTGLATQQINPSVLNDIEPSSLTDAGSIDPASIAAKTAGNLIPRQKPLAQGQINAKEQINASLSANTDAANTASIIPANVFNPLNNADVNASLSRISVQIQSFIESQPHGDLSARIQADVTLSPIVQKIEEKAFQGIPEAQHDLAAIYTAGHAGTEQNFQRAAFWFREAAVENIANARYNLGVLYHQGLGVENDLKQAISWYRAAADLGHPEAQYNLGIAYIEGIGTDYQPQLAAYYFMKAAGQDVPEASYNLGLIYENGLVGNEVPEIALYWYKTAADQGNEEAAAAYQGLRQKLKLSDNDAARLVDQINDQFGTDVTGKLSGSALPNTGIAPKLASFAVDGQGNRDAVVDGQSLVGAIQGELIARGFYPGPADGTYGPQTEDAIRSYQQKNGLVPTGLPSRELLSHLTN